MAKASPPRDGIIFRYGRLHVTVSGRLAIATVAALIMLYFAGKVLHYW